MRAFVHQRHCPPCTVQLRARDARQSGRAADEGIACRGDRMWGQRSVSVQPSGTHLHPRQHTRLASRCDADPRPILAPPRSATVACGVGVAVPQTGECLRCLRVLPDLVTIADAKRAPFLRRAPLRGQGLAGVTKGRRRRRYVHAVRPHHALIDTVSSQPRFTAVTVLACATAPSTAAVRPTMRWAWHWLRWRDPARSRSQLLARRCRATTTFAPCSARCLRPRLCLRRWQRRRLPAVPWC